MIASTPRERLTGMAGALLVQGVVLWALIYGLAIGAPQVATDRMTSFAFTPERPPPLVIPPKHRARGREGAASPANIRSVGTEIYAPPSVVPPVMPPPITASPRPNIGVQATQGAAPVRGPGSGAGGIGNGTGSGGFGDGDGGGGNGEETPPRWVRGTLKDSDFPIELSEAGIGGTVSIQFAVEEDGTVDDCRVTRSSGNTLLDATTCRLVVRRYRYKPARDEDGKPVRAYIVESHSWDVENEPPADGERMRR